MGRRRAPLREQGPDDGPQELDRRHAAVAAELPHPLLLGLHAVELDLELPEHLCGNQNFTARPRWVAASTSTPSTRRLLDGVAMPVPRRSTEPGRPRHRREMTW